MNRFRAPVTLDMTPDGRFTDRRRGFLSWPTKLGAAAAIVAVSLCALVIGALLLWLALWLVAIAAVAGLVAWAAFRFQLWRARHRVRPAPPAAWGRRF